MDIVVKNKVIKRNGEEVEFDITKIINAINAANNEVENIKLKKNLEQRREQYPGHFENLMS